MSAICGRIINGKLRARAWLIRLPPSGRPHPLGAETVYTWTLGFPLPPLSPAMPLPTTPGCNGYSLPVLPPHSGFAGTPEALIWRVGPGGSNGHTVISGRTSSILTADRSSRSVGDIPKAESPATHWALRCPLVWACVTISSANSVWPRYSRRSAGAPAIAHRSASPVHSSLEYRRKRGAGLAAGGPTGG